MLENRKALLFQQGLLCVIIIRAISGEWRRGDSNPKRTSTEPIQLDNNSATEPNRQPSNGLSDKQHNTLPIQNNNSSEHQIGANMVHGLIDTSSDPGLVEIVAVWPGLTKPIKAAIKALIQSHIKEIKNDRENSKN